MRLYSSLCCCHPRLLCLRTHPQLLEQTQAIDPSTQASRGRGRTRPIRLEPHHHVQRGFVLDRPSVAVDLGEPLAVVEEPPAEDQHELLHRRRRRLRPHFCAQNDDEWNGSSARLVRGHAGGAAHSRRGPPATAPSAPAPSSPWRTSRRTAARAASEPAAGAGRAPRGARGAERTSTAELLIMNRSSTPSVVVIAPADPGSAAGTGAFTSSTGVSSTCSTRIDVVAPVMRGSSSDGSATEPKCLSSRLRSR